MTFCKKMTELDLKKKKLPEGYRYVLPTENEWSNLVASATMDQAVASLTVRRTAPTTVGSLAANSLGLYDVRGNVMEFVLSDESQPYRFLKGGSWADFVEVNLRPEFRWYCRPDEAMNTFGFRCLLKAK
jgi:formylglycine-generating enzyme required for sulfatase activity